MIRTRMLTIAIAAWLMVLGGLAISAQDKYTVKVTGSRNEMRSSRIRRRNRHVQARDHSQHAAAANRREVRVRMPHESQG